MNQLAFLAYSQTYNSGWTDWIAHRVVSAVIHAVIYSAVFKIMRQMTTGEAIVLAVVVIGGLFMWSRPRDRREVVNSSEAVDLSDGKPGD